MSNVPGSIFSSNYTENTYMVFDKSQKQTLKHGFGKAIWQLDKPLCSHDLVSPGLIWLKGRAKIIQSYKDESYPIQGLP